MQIYQTNLLNKFCELCICFTTKEDANLAFHVNDKKNSVITNHIKLADRLNYDYKKLIYMKQVHSNIIHIVKQSDDFLHPPTCDAIITDKIETPLMVMVADCSPILMYDKEKKVIAAVHAGRMGAFKNIVKNVINSFANEFKSNPKDIFVTIGANIKKCCYEVGYEIYKEAKELNLEYAIEKKSNKYFLDINCILKAQLLDLGVKSQNIELSKECTSCSKDRYFSYREERKTGRFAGIIFMK